MSAPKMTPEEFSGLGFAAGSVKGVRSFRIDKYGRLTGVVHEQVWLPSENEASCRRGFSGSYQIVVQANQFIQQMQAAGAAIGAMSASASWTGTDTSQLYAKRGRGKGSTIPPKRIPPPNKPAPVQYEVPAEPEHSFERCSCGFYGYFDGSDDYHDNAMVTGVVEAYGEAVIGTRGFRAMKARIIALRVKPGVDEISESQARKVRTNYSAIPMFDSFERMVAEFPADTHLEPSPETDPDFWTRS